MDGSSAILDLIQNLDGRGCLSESGFTDWDDVVDVCPTLWILDQVSVVDRTGFPHILLI